MITSLVAISCGASLGAVSRWLLGLWLNPLCAGIPLGTLVANLVGGYLMGLALGLFGLPSLNPAWRLFVVTGFLGALTTFSTFSAEMTGLLQQGRVFTALAGIALHVCGSLAMTGLGLCSFNLARRLLAG